MRDTTSTNIQESEKKKYVTKSLGKADETVAKIMQLLLELRFRRLNSRCGTVICGIHHILSLLSVIEHSSKSKNISTIKKSNGSRKEAHGMDLFTTYSVKIKKYNHIFKKTVSIYRDAVDYFINVCLNEWMNINALSNT